MLHGPKQLLSMQVAVTYRGRMVLWVLSGFFPLLLMAVWLTVVDESGPPAGWTTSDFLAYYAARGFRAGGRRGSD